MCKAKTASGAHVPCIDLLACPFCGQTPDKIEHDHLGPFVWHQSAWCPIAAPIKMAPDVWQRREQANAALADESKGGAK